MKVTEVKRKKAQNIAVAMAVCGGIVRNTKKKQKRLLTRG